LDPAPISSRERRATILPYETSYAALEPRTPLRTGTSLTSWTHDKFKATGFGKTYPWIDLVNSEEYDGFGIRSDHLADAGWVKTFLRHWSLGVGFGKDVAPGALNGVRDFLRRTAEMISSGKEVPDRDLTKINRTLRIPAYRLLKKRGSASYKLDLVPLHQGWGWVRAEIFKSLALMLAEGQQQRLKICPNPGCRWLFFDQTHGNSRKWCSDLRCGNRDKVRRFRERHPANEGQG
jgi:predicted RNA-binding Zn ribbon-like protein